MSKLFTTEWNGVKSYRGSTRKNKELSWLTLKPRVSSWLKQQVHSFYIVAFPEDHLTVFYGGACSPTVRTDSDYRLVYLMKHKYSIPHYFCRRVQLFFSGVLLIDWISHLPVDSNNIPLSSLSCLFHFATGEAVNYHQALTSMCYSNSALWITMCVFFMPEIRGKTQFSPQLNNEIVFFKLTVC